MSAELADAAFGRLLVAPVDRHADADVYRDAREVARQLGWMKTYDAEYVALAQKLGVELLTRDERLRRGASGLVAVVSPDDLVPPEHSAGFE